MLTTIFLVQRTATQTSTFLINYSDLPSRKDFNFPVKIKFVLRKYEVFEHGKVIEAQKSTRFRLGPYEFSEIKIPQRKS